MDLELNQVKALENWVEASPCEAGLWVMEITAEFLPLLLKCDRLGVHAPAV